jgi:Sec-independent protein translocase protein TatA
MPRVTDFFLLLAVALILLSCTKKIDGNTSFKEATKGFQKELTKDQRNSAIEQLHTERAAKP